MFKFAIIGSLLLASTVEAQKYKNRAVEWDNEPYNVHDYYDGIPDLINVAETKFTFLLIHYFLEGAKMGMYQNKTIKLPDTCFGDYYIKKANELVYTLTEDPFGNIFDNAFPAAFIMYQFYYMITEDCQVDETLNELMIFCWYKGCWPMQFVYKSGDKWLYILRSINDAGIVWQEGLAKVDANDSQREAKYE